MVGPLSSEEIEDVVSSVRRLVSNELLPRSPSRDLTSERLLLTPALRVVTEPVPLAPLVLDAPVVEAAPGRDADHGADAAPDEALAELVPPEPAFRAEDAAEDPGPAQPLGADPALDLEPDLTPVYLAPADDVAPVGESPAAPVERDVVAGQPEADDMAYQIMAEPVEAAWQDALWVEPRPVSLGEVALASEEAEVLADPAVARPTADDPSEAAMSEAGDLAGPVGSDSDDPVPFVPFRRRTEQLSAQPASGEVPAAPAADSAAEAERAATEFVDADGMPLAVLDELALQEIVRQTLRAELQGELGERITRNIRKLVRAEINRAFVARDLD
ncbi:hypothetical protein [Rhodobacter calidifons]|uniref:Cell pole-organizing protein PopZ n=1 Tax=Rhodobacter calidifons TaxID=2715277 RepID=A0ABX0G647_9RHOB|nr:hypothetical protein [Rhodobacter calidifons]NHB76748.1 hypothetical protein [Rhodobacter calidifons]